MASRIVIAGAAALAIAGAAAGGYFFYLRPAHAHGRAAAAQKAKPPKVTYVDIKVLTLRLADTSTEHYIKLTPVLAVCQRDADAFAAKLPVVRDRIVSIVTGRESTELATTAGQQKLKKDLLDALQREFPGEIAAIYFSGYLVE
jgi:flagellar FliL protein